MTIEEAIAQLKILETIRPHLWLADVEAIDIAIKALEENDTFKTEIMAVKSGSDILKICKLEEENKELKRLLRLAVEDFDFIYREHSCVAIGCSTDCPYSDDETYYCKGEWKHAEEAERALEEINIEKNNN